MAEGLIRGFGIGLLVAAVLALAASPVRAAATDLPVGRADGVVVKWKHGVMVVVFTKSAKPLYKRIAGRLVEVACWKRDGDGKWGGGVTFRADKRGRTLHTGDATRVWDYCHVSIPARKVKRKKETLHYPPRPIVSVPITQAGAIHLDQQTKTLMLSSVLTLASLGGEQTPSGRYLTPAQLIEETGGRLTRTPWWRARPPLVPLGSPDDTPPPGAIGYYSDGAEHGAAVTLSLTGRRLFIETDADDVIHTNVLRILEEAFEDFD